MAMMFYGPGNGDGLDWVSFTNQIRGDQARRLGVPADVIRDAQLEAVGRRFNWEAIGQQLLEEKIQRQLRIRAIGYALAAAPMIGQAIIARLPSSVWAAKVGSKKAVKRWAVARALTSRAPRRLFVRVIPYVGWAMVAYDVYTVTFKGELWGVQLWSEG